MGGVLVGYPSVLSLAVKYIDDLVWCGGKETREILEWHLKNTEDETVKAEIRKELKSA